MHALKFTLGGWQFAPGLWPTLVATGLILLTVHLGNWQTERAHYKRILQARVDHADRAPSLNVGSRPVDKAHILYRRVTVRGLFDPEHEILLDNRIYRGVAGYHVLTPLRIEGSNRYVLVNRGWLPVGSSRKALPRIRSIETQVKIEGLALDPDTRYFELPGAGPQGRLWQNLDFVSYATRSGLSLQAFMLQQSNDTNDGLVRDWPRPDTGIAMHESYALQWYGLAATLAMLWLSLNLKRNIKTDVLPK